MKLGKVTGRIMATRKAGQLEGKRLLVVSYLNADLHPTGQTGACVDTVNAGDGEIVLLCGSSSARMTQQTKGVATDLTAVGIVDAISAGKKNLYQKNNEPG